MFGIPWTYVGLVRTQNGLVGPKNKSQLKILISQNS